MDTIQARYTLIIVKYLSLLTCSYVLCLLFVFTVYWYLDYAEYILYAQLKISGYFLESFCLTTFLLILFIVSKRIIFSFLFSALTYGFFIYASIEKSSQLLNPIFFNDLKLINQLFLVEGTLSSYVVLLTPFLIATVLLILVNLKYEPKYKLLTSTWFPSMLLIFTILGSSFIFKSQIKDTLRFNFSVRLNNSHALTTAESFGFLFFFIKDILYSEKINQIEYYSKSNIEKLKSELNLGKQEQNVNKRTPNLIIYMIESFSDPKQAGISTTEDAIPFFRSLQNNHLNGNTYSPVFGGNSANAEFELLTGFSMHFFPKSSIAYMKLPNRNIPSIARELGQLGYYSTAIQPVDLGFFNYKHIYQTLGFDETISLWGREGVEKDPAGRYPSDASLVEEIIKVSEQQEKFFIFAFPNSTHSNWTYSAYENSSLDLSLDSPLQFPGGAKQLKTYINALKTADDALKQLIKHFKTKNEPIAILVVGDHQPGLPEFREQYMSKIIGDDFNYSSRKEMKIKFKRFREQNPIKNFEAFHSVPFVLWTNYESKLPHNYQKGMNSIILKLFDSLEISPSSLFYRFLKRYSTTIKYNTLLEYIYQDSTKHQKWNRDFEAIQYDLLFGQEYLTK